MKKLEAKDLFELKHGDRVYRWEGGNFRKLDFVAPMPKVGGGYLIFCDGEYLTHLFIDHQGCYKGEWYSGEYDSKFVGNLMIEGLQKRIESVKRVYLDD